METEQNSWFLRTGTKIRTFGLVLDSIYHFMVVHCCLGRKMCLQTVWMCRCFPATLFITHHILNRHSYTWMNYLFHQWHAMVLDENSFSSITINRCSLSPSLSPTHTHTHIHRYHHVVCGTQMHTRIKQTHQQIQQQTNYWLTIMNNEWTCYICYVYHIYLCMPTWTTFVYSLQWMTAFSR